MFIKEHELHRFMNYLKLNLIKNNFFFQYGIFRRCKNSKQQKSNQLKTRFHALIILIKSFNKVISSHIKSFLLFLFKKIQNMHDFVKTALKSGDQIGNFYQIHYGLIFQL